MAPDVALIVLVPTATAVAKPPVVIVAVEVVPDAHVTDAVRFCVLLSVNVPVAVNCCVAPLPIDGFAGVTAIDFSVAAVTVNVVDPLIAPDVALIVLVPTATPVAKPPVVIVAVEVVPEAHVTDPVRFCVLLSLNVPVAVNCCVRPFAIDGFTGVTAIDCKVGGPDDRTRFTAEPAPTGVPATGDSLMTSPAVTVLLDWCVIVPTTKPAALIAAVAAVCVSPTTFGTVTEELITVESFTVAGAEPPPLTVAVFTCGETAFDATLTVTVIAP